MKHALTVVGRVASLWVYPVKSCRGTAVDEMRLGLQGPEGDRRLMLVDEKDEFLTQRSEPQMTLIEAVLTEEGGIRLSFCGEELQLRIPFAGNERDVGVWGDRVNAKDCGDPAADRLSTWLGRPCRLVAFPEQGHRLRSDGTEGVTAFADAEPVLLTSAASLAELNGLLATPVTMERFRPNIVVVGPSAWQEDGWSRLWIGSAELEVVKPCARCPIVGVEPKTGERDDAPLQALARIRYRDGKVWFGQNARVLVPGAIRCGDPVRSVG